MALKFDSIFTVPSHLRLVTCCCNYSNLSSSSSSSSPSSSYSSFSSLAIHKTPLNASTSSTTSTTKQSSHSTNPHRNSAPPSYATTSHKSSASAPNSRTVELSTNSNKSPSGEESNSLVDQMMKQFDHISYMLDTIEAEHEIEDNKKG